MAGCKLIFAFVFFHCSEILLHWVLNVFVYLATSFSMKPFLSTVSKQRFSAVNANAIYSANVEAKEAVGLLFVLSA